MKTLTNKLIKGFIAEYEFWKSQVFGELVTDKQYWLRYKELKGFHDDSPFCEYYRECEACPLKSCFNYGLSPHNGYWRWGDYTNSFITRRFGALQMLLKIRKWLKANLPEYFNKKRK